MFVQVITATATDPTAVRRHWERWDRDLKACAEGYLGSTAGVAEDGTFVAMVRFDTQAAARRNEARDAQARWWGELGSQLDDVAVHDCTTTEVWASGGSDDAGFVQIRQGVTSNAALLRDVYLNQQPVRMGPVRPEVIGGVLAWHDDSDRGFTISAYFTCEDDARRGENLEEFKTFFAACSTVMHDLNYIDLRHPWLSSR